MTPAEREQGLVRLDGQLARHPFVDGSQRSRNDVGVRVGLRFGGPLDKLAALVESYRSLGATRVVVALATSSSGFEGRLGAIADALAVEPATIG